MGIIGVFARASTRFGLVFLLFCALTAAMFWQWMPHLSSALIGPPEDNLQDFWNSWYVVAGHDPASFYFTHLLRWPEGTPLHYHSFAYTQIPFVWLGAQFAGTDFAALVLLQNLGLLLTFPVAGLGAFYLVRHFTGNDWAALAGGFVFAFNPSHVMHVMHHAHVSSIGLLPFFVLFWILAMERKSFGWLGAAIVLWALNALSCWYYLFYAGFFVLFHSIFLMWRDNRLPRGWRLFAPFAGAVGTVVLLLPILLPMWQQGGNQHAYAAGGNEYVADLLGYFTFPSIHLFGEWSEWLYRRFTGNLWENTVYLGLVNLALLLWLIVRAWRRGGDPLLRYLLIGMLVFAVLASGEALHVGGEILDFLHLPPILFADIPFLANLRTPSRAIVMVYLFLAIAVGHAVALAWPHRHKPVVAAGMGVVALLMVLDFYPARELEMTPMACREGMELVRNDPAKDFGVLDLPGGYVESNYYMAQQACHGRPIAQGSVSRQLYATLGDRLEIKDMAAQRVQLVKAKVKYITLMPQQGTVFPWREEKDGVRALYERTYPVVFKNPRITVLKVY